MDINGRSYLRVDSSIECVFSDPEFMAILFVDMPFIALYQTIPIGYATLFWRNRKRLNPGGFFSDESARKKRDEDPNTQSFKFLFKDYTCESYYFEVIDMYRRIALIG